MEFFDKLLDFFPSFDGLTFSTSGTIYIIDYLFDIIYSSTDYLFSFRFLLVWWHGCRSDLPQLPKAVLRARSIMLLAQHLLPMRRVLTSQGISNRGSNGRGNHLCKSRYDIQVFAPKNPWCKPIAPTIGISRHPTLRQQQHQYQQYSKRIRFGCQRGPVLEATRKSFSATQPPSQRSPPITPIGSLGCARFKQNSARPG